MDTMQAICVGEDAQRSLRWQSVPAPRPGPEEVLLRVRATAVNRADLLQRAGRYPPPPGASPILGLEAAGELAALGEQVRGLAVGQRVCALLPGGGYAEQVTCRADALLPLPDGLRFTEAAALPEALYTAHLGLYREGQLRAGERALIHAGASGIGSVAIQLCRVRGATVYATASAAKRDLCTRLGAAAAWDRDAEDFTAWLRELTAGAGVDAILDPVGGAYLARNVAALARGGRLVIIGLLGGAAAELPLAELLMRNLRVIGTTLRSRSAVERAALTREIAADAWPAVAAGAIAAVIDRVLPIHEAEAAHALLRANQTAGKVVLEMP
jgi:putative PIG3 family NAD(P)H quinone oxidoreductase